MSYILILEGQEIPLTEAVAATDETLRSAFVPFFPQLATAEIFREKVGETIKIRMVKKAGTKNSDILQYLADCEESLNPALALSWQLKMLEIQGDLSIQNIIPLQSQINKAIAVGNEWSNEVDRSLQALTESNAVPSLKPVSGF